MLFNFTPQLQAIGLGLVQGLTEFIPVSSSGHLVLVRQLLGWPDQGLDFDAVLHLATALAVLVYFWADWRRLFLSLVSRKQTREFQQARRLAGLIVITTMPAIGAGLLLEGWVEHQLRDLLAVASLMIITGLMMLVVERAARAHRDISKLHFWDALSIGLAQAAAILPGISRSGATIMTGMYHGLKREVAARYSFLAAGPIVVLAGTASLWRLLTSEATTRTSVMELGLGFAASLVAGLIAIAFLIRFLKTHSLYVFAGYLMVVGVGLIIFKLLS